MYNTKQKQLLLEILVENSEKCLSTNELFDICRSKKLDIGLTTIYRYLNDLEKKFKVIKYTNGNGESSYQLNKNNCGEDLHLKCNCCGKVIHLDCEIIEELKKHVLNEHKFKIDTMKTVINGLCENCNRREK
ncbi:MAG: transcriptional repressor [Clostridia bacterium]